MRKPVDGEVHVHYGQIYVVSEPAGIPDLYDAFAGQTSGLCGAAVPGTLWLITGLHTGDVGFTVEVHDRAPDPDPMWEDVVEVSYRPLSEDVALTEWGGGAAWELGLRTTDYRVRYCAQGMDRGRELDTRTDDEEQADRYLLQFWPAPPEPDRILRQTSDIAAYWHGVARELPPPPTPAERAEAERRARAEQERADRQRELARERREWGGRLPSDALRAVEGMAGGLLRFDADLVHALDAAGPEVQRAVAVFAARRACTAAGIAELPWIAPALTALAEGRALPAPFGDWELMFQTLSADPQVPDRTVTGAVPPGRSPGAYPVSQPHMALPAVVHAAAENPLEAALGAVHDAVAAHGERYPTLLRDVRAACAGEGGVLMA